MVNRLHRAPVLPSTIALIFLSSILTAKPQAHAWGKRGHAIVCETAAYLASSAPKGEFLKSHSFDLGYYCNVPDIVWKAPATYKVEWTNHFMDMEIFKRGTKDSKVQKPLELERQAFNTQFPEVKDEAGRAFWRIRELEERLKKATEELQKADIDKEARHKLQADWLVLAGVIGHYIGDLAQPMHVTENYDGQLTGQKGLHSFYEERLVDHLFLSKHKPQLTDRIQQLAIAKWPVYRKQAEKKATSQVIEELATESNKLLAAVLKADKKTGRKDVEKAALEHRDTIVRSLVAGSLAQAELYRRHLGWDYNGEKFYTFVSAPEFIAPPAALVAPSPSPAPSPK